MPPLISSVEIDDTLSVFGGFVTVHNGTEFIGFTGEIEVFDEVLELFEQEFETEISVTDEVTPEHGIDDIVGVAGDLTYLDVSYMETEIGVVDLVYTNLIIVFSGEVGVVDSVAQSGYCERFSCVVSITDDVTDAVLARGGWNKHTPSQSDWSTVETKP